MEIAIQNKIAEMEAFADDERDEEVKKYLSFPMNSKAKWIHKTILPNPRHRKWKELNQGKVNREYVNGQSFLYLGRNYRLKIVDNQDVPLKNTGGFFLLDKKHLDKADKVFKDFYKAKAEQKIKERLKMLIDKFQHKPSTIKVLELRNRWASWTPKNGLNFHWKCIMAPVSVIDYIITHEMVHLKFPNHSTEFWNELDKKMPDFREHENWLKRNGVKMSL